jgi:hypothetical protein
MTRIKCGMTAPSLAKASAVLFGLLLQALPASAMTFSLTRIEGPGFCKPSCPLVIVANGAITGSSPQEFVNFLRAVPDISRIRSAVMLNSPGGNVVGALVLGLVWKEMKIAAYVAQPVAEADGVSRQLRPGRCYSACAYALLGARARVIPQGSQVGIHRMHVFQAARDPAEGGFQAPYVFAPNNHVEVLRRYVATVGASPRVVDLAEAVGPESIKILTPEEMRALRVSTAAPGGSKTAGKARQKREIAAE